MSTTSTEQRKTIVRKYLDRVWNAGDLSVVDDHFAADAVHHESSHHEGELMGTAPTGQSVEASGMAFYQFEVHHE